MVKRLLWIEAFVCCMAASTALSQTVQPWFDSPLDGQVNSIVVSGNKAYLGGTFTKIGYASGTGAFLDTATAKPDRTFPKLDRCKEECTHRFPTEEEDGMSEEIFLTSAVSSENIWCMFAPTIRLIPGIPLPTVSSNIYLSQVTGCMSEETSQLSPGKRAAMARCSIRQPEISFHGIRKRITRLLLCNR